MYLAPVIAVGLLLTGLVAPLPSDWQLRSDHRQAFLGRYAGAHVTVEYVADPSPFHDPDLLPVRSTGGLLARGVDGRPMVFAAARLLERGASVKVRFSDGTEAHGEVVLDGRALDLPLARVVLHDPSVLERHTSLAWAAEVKNLTATPAWAIEAAPSVMPDGRPAHVLVDTAIGTTVEPPLTHLYYVNLRHADGLPLLNGVGEILCVVFRGSPVHEGRSLCAPGTAAGPPVATPTPLEITP